MAMTNTERIQSNNAELREAIEMAKTLPDKVTDAVLYTAQELTAEQQEQARENIGAQEKGSYIFNSEFEEITKGFAQKTEVPKNTSDLNNDSGYITHAVSTLLNYYLKSETFAKSETYSKTDVDGLVGALERRIEAFWDTDDETLDQLSELVEYINSNKELIDAITTDKVSVSDIVNNLITSDTGKPLSAEQGVVLKSIVDRLQEKKLDVESLYDAINIALDQAKESGEFDGEDGKDGVSVTHSWNGTTLTVTSASGTSSADLKGEKGEKGDTGSQGPKGDPGETGPAGKDGTSVTVKSVSQSSESGGSNVVTFSDGKTVTIKNGSDGKTPVKGTDYFTPADKAEMVAQAAEGAKRKYGKLLVFGDSLGEGANNNSYSFVDILLESGMFESVVKACKGGATVGPYQYYSSAQNYDLNSQIERYITDVRNADIILCEYGANDVSSLTRGLVQAGTPEDSASTTTVCGYIKKAINRIRALNPDVHIQWFSPYPLDFQALKTAYPSDMAQVDNALLFNATALKTVNDCGCGLIIPSIGLHENFRASDNFHPNTEGHRIIAEYVAKGLYTSAHLLSTERILKISGNTDTFTNLTVDGKYANIYKLVKAGVPVKMVYPISLYGGTEMHSPPNMINPYGVFFHMITFSGGTANVYSTTLNADDTVTVTMAALTTK